jgi:glycosyl transferase family 25
MPDFTSLNNFFNQIYVITLPRAIERQDAIRANLAGLNFVFFMGADKLDHSRDDLERDNISDEALYIQNHRHNRTITLGHICCSWSHRNVYEDILKNGYERVLILEDDVITNKGWIKIFPEILKELPADWGLLFLDYSKNVKRRLIKQNWYHIQKFLFGHKWSHESFRNLYPRRVSAHLSTAGRHDFSSAYAITSVAAKKLKELQSPISYNADTLLAHACSNKIINGYISRPKIFQQLSTISGNEIFSYVAD